MRMTLPIFVTALIPISTLRKLNEWLSNHESQEGEVHSERKNDQAVDLKFLFIPQKPPSSLLWDMWIFVIKGRLFPMVPMIPTRSVYSAWLETVFCLRPIGKNTSSSVRGKSEDLVCLWPEFDGATESSYPSAFSGDRRPVNSLGTKLAVDEKKRGRGKAYLLLPTKKRKQMRPSINSAHPSLRPTLFSVPIVFC